MHMNGEVYACTANHDPTYIISIFVQPQILARVPVIISLSTMPQDQSTNTSPSWELYTTEAVCMGYKCQDSYLIEL